MFNVVALIMNEVEFSGFGVKKKMTNFMNTKTVNTRVFFFSEKRKVFHHSLAVVLAHGLKYFFKSRSSFILSSSAGEKKSCTKIMKNDFERISTQIMWRMRVRGARRFSLAMTSFFNRLSIPSSTSTWKKSHLN